MIRLNMVCILRAFLVLYARVCFFARENTRILLQTPLSGALCRMVLLCVRDLDLGPHCRDDWSRNDGVRRHR